MILRVYEPCAKFGTETTEYNDYICDTYQVYQGVLHIMRYLAGDLYLPLANLKLFHQLPECVAAGEKSEN